MSLSTICSHVAGISEFTSTNQKEKCLTYAYVNVI